MSDPYKKIFFLLLCCFSLSMISSAQADEDIDTLLGLSLERLMNINVSVASKRPEKISKAPSIVSVITRQDIERYAGQDLFDVIRRLPNLDIHMLPIMPTGVGPTIRGQHPSGATNRVLTLLDGRPVRESQLGGWDQAFYRSFPLESVERIEMIRGPGSALYGTNAFSGVLNIITKKADQVENQGSYMSAGYGSFATKTGQASYRTYNEEHDFALTAAINYLDSAGWEYELEDVNNVFDDDELSRDAVGGFIHARYKNLTVSGFRGQTNNKFQNVFSRWPFGDHKQQREFLEVGYEQPLWGDWKTNFHVTYNGFENKAVQPTSISDENNFHDVLYEISVGGSLFDSLNIISGVTYDDRQGTLKVGSSRFDEALEGFYFQADYTPVDWLKLIGGVQLNKPEVIEVAQISPRAGAIVHFTPQIGAKLLYGEAFRSPEGSAVRLNIPAAVGNPSLKSETIRTKELQLFYSGERYSSALTLYRSDVDGTIATGANPNAPPALTFLNGGKTEYKGVELEGKAYPNDRLEMQGSLTYQMGRDPLTNVTDISISPHLMFKLGASYEWDNGITLGVFNQHVSDMVRYNPARLPNRELHPKPKSTNMLTANLSVNLNEAFDLKDINMPETTFSLYGDNLLDEDIYYATISGGAFANTFPGYSGRAVYGRLSVKF